ncbi:hypothetical protein FIBSPDRAFT_873935, partial [Athelia psychrophila]
MDSTAPSVVLRGSLRGGFRDRAAAFERLSASFALGFNAMIPLTFGGHALVALRSLPRMYGCYGAQGVLQAETQLCIHVDVRVSPDLR